MRVFPVLILVLLSFAIAHAQNEQAPIIEKDIEYKNWKLKRISGGEAVNLREYAAGRKLVMVVYFAPWCGNWKHDAPMLQKLYDKYRDQGLGIVAVGEYDPVTAMQANLDALKITFPAVYESENRTEKLNTLHYAYRKSTGDTRNWGSPWYIFLTPTTMEGAGDTLTKRAFVINGEMIESEGEKFIRERLGLAAAGSNSAIAAKQFEACEPDKRALLVKP
ncbi:MAG TPA: redoxin domain-containing protein [Pyrinomonadaceae bacterium]|jgi:thiol-disulfide isomerase/thioredoxin|nr:redoxin domain-containing protein [Pyrinomonadaceae bacterium]